MDSSSADTVRTEARQTPADAPAGDAPRKPWIVPVFERISLADATNLPVIATADGGLGSS
jgi:hypothetical protein